MITIVLQNGIPFVWTANDWLKIREEFRIIGNLSGCLAGLPRQELFKGLPVMLLNEEVTLLLKINAAVVKDDSALFKIPDEKLKEKFCTYRDNSKKEQIACYETDRKQQITLVIDRIIEGKRRKSMGLSTKKKKLNHGDSSKSEDMPASEEYSASELDIDREEIFKSELNKSATNFSPPLLVQTFSKDPWVDESQYKEVEWKFPETDQEKLRYSTFKDLWEKGYYLTEGHKFGVDYLVYPGDPVKFHAQFLVVCVQYEDVILTVDLLSYARLGSVTRKTFVIATKPPNSENILYQSMQWCEKS